MDWKLQNNHEKRRKTNETVLSKSDSWKPRKTSEEQAGQICHISVNRNQETGNRQTDRQTNKQTDKVL